MFSSYADTSPKITRRNHAGHIVLRTNIVLSLTTPLKSFLRLRGGIPDSRGDGFCSRDRVRCLRRRQTAEAVFVSSVWVYFRSKL
jgi:hypothetical protein